MHCNDDRHPIIAMNEGLRTLREQAKAAHGQAALGAAQAREAAEALAALDLEQAFRQLREMVALISEPTDRPARQPRQAENVVPFPGGARPAALLAQAAE